MSEQQAGAAEVRRCSSVPDSPSEMRSERWHMKKVLFVCTANICRSPMAEAIFNTLAEDKDVPFRAESTGTAALVGRSMAPNAVAALEEVGIYPEARRARQVNEALLEEFELVLAMSPQHVMELRRLPGNPPRAVYTLPEYATGVSDAEGISDPYGHTMAAYRSSVRQLYEYVERVINNLAG